MSREIEPKKQRPPKSPTKTEVLASLEALQAPLRARGIHSVALFGSVVRGTAGAGSDIDVLIDLVPGSRFSLIDMAETKGFLEKQFGRNVDLVTREGLDPAIRDRVLREAESAF